MKAIYYDMPDVKDEIKSFVNIERYGDLYYKKMTLCDYSKKLLQENDIKIFYRITNKEELSSLIEKMDYPDTEDFIILSSNLTIINQESFSFFLKKIKYLNNSLALCGPDCIKPFMKLSHKEALIFLKLTFQNENFYKVLEQRAESIEKFSQESFFHEIKDYGGFVTYLQTNFELRYFNSLHSSKHTLTKRSNQKEKMLKEFTYYSVLPPEMKIFFLPPFNYKETSDYSEYSMERLNILDVSIQWIHYSISKDEFKSLLQRLFHFLSIRKRKETQKEGTNKNLTDLYISKLDNRIEDFKKASMYKQVNDVIQNSTSYQSLENIISRYKLLIEKIHTEKKYHSVSVISHGDLCFSNILYDKRIDFIKLIDPKGCLQEKDAYVESYYDVAKLSHSILGSYDFINNGIFEIRYDNQLQVSLEILHPEALSEHKELFKQFLKENGFLYEVVRLYEASLFLSMIPLHIDYPKKVLAFILTAIKILEELEVKYGKI